VLRLFYIVECDTARFLYAIVHLKFRHRHPLGYLLPNFIFCGLHCWVSPWWKITYSVTHSPSHWHSLLDAPGTEALALRNFDRNVICVQTVQCKGSCNQYQDHGEGLRVGTLTCLLLYLLWYYRNWKGCLRPAKNALKYTNFNVNFRKCSGAMVPLFPLRVWVTAPSADSNPQPPLLWNRCLRLCERSIFVLNRHRC